MEREGVVVNVGVALVDFRKALSRIAYFRTVGGTNLIQRELLDYLIEYIADEQNAFGSILDFVADQRANYTSVMTPFEMTMFVNALITVGGCLIDTFRQHGLFDQQGTLWYAHHAHWADTLVLRRISPDECTN